jgi:hypothetical protein
VKNRVVRNRSKIAGRATITAARCIRPMWLNRHSHLLQVLSSCVAHGFGLDDQRHAHLSALASVHCFACDARSEKRTYDTRNSTRRRSRTAVANRRPFCAYDCCRRGLHAPRFTLPRAESNSRCPILLWHAYA